jgi:hypothetical protein
MEKLYGGNAGVVSCGEELSRCHTKGCNYKASLQQCEMQKLLIAEKTINTSGGWEGPG